MPSDEEIANALRHIRGILLDKSIKGKTIAKMKYYLVAKLLYVAIVLLERDLVPKGEEL